MWFTRLKCNTLTSTLNGQGLHVTPVLKTVCNNLTGAAAHTLVAAGGYRPCDSAVKLGPNTVKVFQAGKL